MRAVLNWIKRHGWVHLVIVAIFTLPTIWVLRVVPNKDEPIASKLRLLLDGLEYQTVDARMYYGRKAEVDPHLVLLSIDSPSIRLDALDPETIQQSHPLSDMQATRYPFPREVYGDACERLLSAGAKVVAFDLLFLTPSPTDAAFKQALDKYHDQIVIGSRFSTESLSLDVPPDTLLSGSDPLDPRLGYVNYWQDSTENVVRDARYRTNLEYLSQKPSAANQPKLYSLDARIVQHFGRDDLVPDDFLSRPIRFIGQPIPTYSFYQIFDPHNWDATFAHGAYFRDKIVVVGPDGELLKDTVHTPVGELAGVQLHLNSVNALLHQDFLKPASDGFSIGVVFVTAIFALILAALIHSIAIRFGLALALAAVYTTAAMVVYNGPGWLLPMVAPTFVFGGSVSVGFVYDFVVAQLERYRLRITFERYNSKNVVKYLLAHPDSYNQMLVGTHRDVSVLFSDIRSFTTIVETAPDPRELVRKLNEYLTSMVDCVIKQDGNLEKFMGDGIMAVWGNTPYSSGPKDDAIRAVRAALAMGVELKRLNAKWVSEGLTEWRIGVGVNHGNVIVGDMGSPDHKEFAMVGDPVNLGSRLEGLTKEYHVQIMIGELAADLVADVFYLRSVDLVKVKGKNKAVKTFTVLGEKKDGLPPEKIKFLQLHEEAMAAFRAREFDQARKLFESALQIEPDDFIAGDFLKSAAHYAAEPPPAGWDGVRVMKEK